VLGQQLVSSGDAPNGKNVTSSDHFLIRSQESGLMNTFLEVVSKDFGKISKKTIIFKTMPQVIEPRTVESTSAWRKSSKKGLRESENLELVGNPIYELAVEISCC